MNTRFEQLDSLRGLAALSVVFCHFFMISSIPFFENVFSPFSPFKILIDGHSAVILFFVLSGFVLSLPFIKGNQVSYKIFIGKRFFRIYVPYIISLILTIFVSLTLYTSEANNLSSWFNQIWSDPISIRLIIEHIFLLGNFNTNAFNNVIWSLVHEMRISVIFPILAFILIKMNWKWTLMFSLFLSIISGINNLFNIELSSGYNNSFFFTLHYISIFLLGGLVAKHKNYLIEKCAALSKNKTTVLILFAFICYSYSGSITIMTNYIGIPFYGEIASDYVVVLGSVLFILVSLSSTKITSLLLLPPLKYLGKISYSLYLYHIPVLLSSIYLLNGLIPLYAIFIVSFISIILISHFTWRFIEKPSMNLSKNLSSRYNKKSMNNKLKVS